MTTDSGSKMVFLEGTGVDQKRLLVRVSLWLSEVHWIPRRRTGESKIGKRERGRERQKERQRETNRQTHRQKDKQRQKEKISQCDVRESEMQG